MRVRDHALLSTGAAVLLFPWMRGKVLIPWASSILIDVDHYVWFCARTLKLDPREAINYYTGAKPPQHAGTRLLHYPPVLALLFLLGRRSRLARLALTGIAFHIGIDAFHVARMAAARNRALQRDLYTCQRCGAIAPDMVAHQWRQPSLFPSYSPDYLTSLCESCHETVHAQGQANELLAPLPMIRTLRGATSAPGATEAFTAHTRTRA